MSNELLVESDGAMVTVVMKLLLLLVVVVLVWWRFRVTGVLLPPCETETESPSSTNPQPQ
jgi:hypothetical protein